MTKACVAQIIHSGTKKKSTMTVILYAFGADFIPGLEHTATGIANDQINNKTNKYRLEL